MNITKKVNGINFNIDFSDKDDFYLFFGMSGTGKTFSFKVLKNLLRDEGFSVVSINSMILDSMNYDTNLVMTKCLDNSVNFVILDNADLYLTQEFLNKLESSGKKVIICTKKLKNLIVHNFGSYRVEYEGNDLFIRRNL